MTTPTGEAPKQRGERTDNSVKKLPNGKGWRARPTLGTDPVTGKQVRPTKVFAHKKAAQDWVTEQRSQWSTAAWTPKSTRTFDEVADHWLTLRARPIRQSGRIRCARTASRWLTLAGHSERCRCRSTRPLPPSSWSAETHRQGRQGAGTGHETPRDRSGQVGHGRRAQDALADL